MTHHNWHETVFFGIHHDLHANPSDLGLGRDLTHEHLKERLLRSKPDWIQCDCKGHAGWTSWFTEVGSQAPNITRDSVRIYRDVTKELGIRLGMHYSGVWDSRAIQLHPEWGRIDENGNRDPNNTCRLSSYDDELMIPQMLELIDKYDVDGFWVDGENWAARACWCERCTAEFTRRTGIQTIPHHKTDAYWQEWQAFHRDLFVEHVTKYTNAIHQRKPECMVCSNWMYTVRQPDPITAPVDYLSGDFDWCWGADRAAVEGRVLDCRNKTWDLMAWSFLKTGPMNDIDEQGTPWITKTPLHLCQEVAEVVALGGAVMLYDNPQRSGWITSWHADLYATVAEFCRARKEVCFQTQTIPQAAILHLASHFYSKNDDLFNYGIAAQPLEGALHALLETHRSTDILTEDAALERLDAYPLVVVPEQTHLSQRLLEKLTSYVKEGGNLFLSGIHLARECPELAGVQPETEDDTLPKLPEQQICLPLGITAIPVGGKWRKVVPLLQTEVWATRMTQQEPGKNDTDQVLVTNRKLGKGQVTAVHGDLFNNYYLGHFPQLRRFIAELIHRMNVPWMIEVNASPRLEIILRQKGNRRMVNILNRGAGETFSPRRVMLEELPFIEDISIRIRCEVKPAKITAPFEPTDIQWEWHDGWTSIWVEKLHIHNTIIIE